MKSYIIWNNKGGIGKTMLSFLLSTGYALEHPDENTVVIDMCPQANISQVLLGGTDNINSYLEVVENNNTIADYFISRYQKSPYTMTGSETSFLLNDISSHNANVPDNLYLVSGNSKLELLNTIIDRFAAPGGFRGIDEWKAIYSWINDLKKAITNKIGENTSFFIDTNPSFANYTKMAILSADRLIIPCFADVGSLLALENLMFFLYNVRDEKAFGSIDNNFYELAKEHGMSIPMIYMVVVGRSTQYNNKAAAAFKHLEEKIMSRIEELKKKHNGKIFINSSFPIVQQLRDLNSAAPLINVRGELLNNLKGGQATGLHTKQGTEMMVPTNIKEFKDAVNNLVKLL